MPRAPKQQTVTRVLLVGAGQGGKAMIEVMRDDPAIEIAGVVDKERHAAGLEAFSPEAMALLCQYSWPGNLREMQNVIESAVILAASSVIEPEHLPFHAQDQSLSFELCERQGFMQAKHRVLDNFEKQALSSFLLQTRGNISKAAELAKIPRRTFHRLIDKHRLKARSFKS